MSAAEQNPDHAGEQYTSLAATVARKTSYGEVAGMPCVFVRSEERSVDCCRLQWCLLLCALHIVTVRV